MSSAQIINDIYRRREYPVEGTILTDTTLTCSKEICKWEWDMV